MMDNSLNYDGSEFQFHIALKSEDSTLVHEVHVHFQVLYSVVEDMKRWFPAGVLKRFEILSPPAYLTPHRLWGAFPPLPEAPGPRDLAHSCRCGGGG